MKLNRFLIISLLMISVSPVLKAVGNEHEHHNHEMIKGEKPSSKSLYQVKSNWVNRDKKEIKLNYFKGKPVIVTMLYTTCKNSCPLIMSHLKFLETSLKGNKNKVNFVIVSLDPTKDKPEVFQKFAIKNQSEGHNWYYLNGKQESVEELAALLGIKFKKTPDGEIMHTNKITVLNNSGEIVLQEENLNDDQEKVIQAVKKSILGVTKSPQ